MECTDLVNKIHRLQAALEHDQQVAAKTRMLFEALKTELHKKETELSIAGTRYKQSSQQYKTELAVARKAVEDMAERLILLEEEKNSVESAAHRTKTELDVVHNETAHCQSEVARWASMYAELEKVLSSLKTQISTAQFSHASEVNTLQSEVARWKQDCEKSSAELAAHTSTLSSVVTDMSSITSLQIPTTLTQLHHYRSEVVAIVRSMKRFVSKLPDAQPLNTTFRHIASIIDDLSHRTLTYQEALFMSTSSGTQESQRAAELQSRLFKAEQELAQADSSAEGMLQMFTKAGFVYALSDKETRGSGGESESGAKGVARVESLNTEVRFDLYCCQLLSDVMVPFLMFNQVHFSFIHVACALTPCQLLSCIVHSVPHQAVRSADSGDHHCPAPAARCHARFPQPPREGDRPPRGAARRDRGAAQPAEQAQHRDGAHAPHERRGPHRGESGHVRERQRGEPGEGGIQLQVQAQHQRAE